MSIQTKLLVSVKNLAEATLAAQHSVDVIDIKNPNAGSLGAPDRRVAQRIISQFAATHWVSVAMGELEDFRPCSLGYLQGCHYAKIGLAGSAANSNWQSSWNHWAGLVSEVCQPVAVCYADFKFCNSPSPSAMTRCAVEAGCGTLLLDTNIKNGTTLLDIMSLRELSSLIDQVQNFGLKIAIAGSLDTAAIEQLLPLAPDFIAVRGAACGMSSRNGTIQPARLNRLVRLMNRHSVVRQS